jgi:putative hemolysin
MTPRPDVEWLDLQGSDDEIRDAIRGATHGRVLAANGDIDEVVGAIPVRAALVALLDGGVGAIRALVPQIPAVSGRLGAIDVVEQLRQSPFNMVMVVDEHGSLEGIVTEGDILNHRRRHRGRGQPTRRAAWRRITADRWRLSSSSSIRWAGLR